MFKKNNVWHLCNCYIFINSCILSVSLSIIVFSNRIESFKIKLVSTVFSALFIIISVLLFINFKPTYDVNSALEILSSYLVIDELKLDNEFLTISVTLKPNLFIHSAYVFCGELNSKTITIIFNPVTGDYYIMDL